MTGRGGAYTAEGGGVGGVGGGSLAHPRQWLGAQRLSLALGVAPSGPRLHFDHAVAHEGRPHGDALLGCGEQRGEVLVPLHAQPVDAVELLEA